MAQEAEESSRRARRVRLAPVVTGHLDVVWKGRLSWIVEPADTGDKAGEVVGGRTVPRTGARRSFLHSGVKAISLPSLGDLLSSLTISSLIHHTLLISRNFHQYQILIIEACSPGFPQHEIFPRDSRSPLSSVEHSNPIP